RAHPSDRLALLTRELVAIDSKATFAARRGHGFADGALRGGSGRNRVDVKERGTPAISFRSTRGSSARLAVRRASKRIPAVSAVRNAVALVRSAPTLNG